MDDHQDETAAEVDRLIFGAVDACFPGAVTTKYLLVGEVLDTDGSRTVVTIRDDNGAPWDTYALARAAMVKADLAMCDDCDDE